MNGELQAKRSEFSREDFVHVLVENLSEVLDICHKDRPIFKPILNNILYQKLLSKNSIIEELITSEFERLLSAFKVNLLLPNELNLNYNRSTYNKFDSILEYIAKNYIKKDDIEIDGTFKTIEQKIQEKYREVDGCCESSSPQCESGY